MLENKSIFIILMLLLSGCATYTPYSEQLPEVKYDNINSVLISVVDKRGRVIKGRPANFIGVYRVNFGIPIKKYTADLLSADSLEKDSTLSDFLQARVVDGMLNKGWDVKGKDLMNIPSSNIIKETMRQTSTEKWMLIVLKEWYFSTDMHFNTSFNFDVDADVLIYGAGAELAHSQKIKKRNIIDEHDDRHNDITFAYKKILTEIINSKDLSNALSK